MVEQVYDHHGNVGMNTTPPLVFDAREHACHLQYRNVRPDDVEKLWDLIDWNDVSPATTPPAAPDASPMPATSARPELGPWGRADAAPHARSGMGVGAGAAPAESRAG
ncbi:Fe-Mn family superoxide dismutase [Nonomuraea fastidiosa]|uniref:Fe-Mn family superoxide dismutase n=1 Tax=Nonomuraea fastidiosa TaxID=46173 RepID=UPI00367263D2